MEKDLYLASIQHAIELAGGCEALAHRIDASPQEVLEWTQGKSSPGTLALLLVLDVVIAETRKLSSGTMARGLAEATLAKAAASAKAVG